jgi:epoxyqueuosine reductase
MTIEDPEPPSAGARSAIGEHLFGCDVCQEVCPYNRAAPPDAARTAPFHPHARWEEIDLDAICAMDEATWDATFQGTPLRRPRRAGIARNAVIVAENRLRAIASGAQSESEEGKESKEREDSAAGVARRAIEAALRHDDEVVRDIAAAAASAHGLPVKRAERDEVDPARGRGS